MKPKARQTLLLVVMVVVCLLVARQYLPMLQPPTASRVAERERTLKSLQSDLMVARKTEQDRQSELLKMRGLAAPFWIPANPAVKVEQEISTEFSRIMRLAMLSSAAGSQKVDVNKEKNGSCLQEVVVSIEAKGVSMRELTRFFSLMRTTPSGKKFRWEYAKIQPDNPRTPSAVNFSARLKVLVLNQDARAFLGLSTAPMATSSEKAAAIQKGSSQKKGVSTTSTRSGNP